MKKLIIASVALLTIALPATAKTDYDIPDCERTHGRECRGAAIIAQSSDNWNYGEHEPEKREPHAQDDEILSNCVNTNRNLYCADEYEGGGIMEINDTGFYYNCRFFGCFEAGNERFIRSENGRLIQVNPRNKGE